VVEVGVELTLNRTAAVAAVEVGVERRWWRSRRCRRLRGG
jgi:hypothetical protein